MSCWEGLCKSIIEKGYSCNSDNKLLVLEVNNDFLIIQLDNNKKITNISLYEDKTDLKTIFQSQCEEIEVKIDEVYYAEYMPRIYYTIYTLKTSNGFEFYLLEQLDVSFMYIIKYYPCQNFDGCKKKIKEIQESLTYSSRGKIREAYVK